MRGDIDRTHRLAARRIEGVQLVSRGKPDVPAIEGDAMYVIYPREGAVFSDYFGLRFFHALILIVRQRAGE